MSTTPASPVPAPARLAILDDHEILLDSLATWIEKNAPEFDLVLRAGSWIELVHSDAFPTDLVIMDLQLRESVSIGARVRTCRAAGAKVIVLSAVYADGRTTSEVAKAMNVQYETAKTYLRRVREKYGKAGRPTSSRADLIRRAAEDGYLT